LEDRVERDDQFVSVSSSPSLALEDSFTLTAWIKLNLIGDGRIIDKGIAGSLDNGFSFDVLKLGGTRNGALRYCGAGGCYISTRRLSVGIWYHVAVVFENAQNGLKFYINGKSDSKYTPTGKTVKNSLPLTFGRSSSGGGAWRPYHQATVLDGIIDDISIWNVVLSLQDVQNLMYNRLVGDEEGLVGYWGFNEGSGSIVNDASSFGNHGSLYGNPTWIKSITKPLNDPSNVERGE